MKHFLSLADLARKDFDDILERAARHKRMRGNEPERPLGGQSWGLVFSKSSTRTRVSFEVGIREMGGRVIFLNSGELQTGRGEPVKDTARVLGRMLHGAVIRTASHQEVVDFARYGGIPTINALTDEEHPCQIIADLLTAREILASRDRPKTLEGMSVAFVGDGTSNVATSWIHAAVRFRFPLFIAAPGEFWPRQELRDRSEGCLVCTEDPVEAVRGTDLVYTDVWVSMGMEAEREIRIRKFRGYQIHSGLLGEAPGEAVVMHCLPAYRGLEITDEVLEAHQRTIFDQAENRLHAQKGILSWLTAR